MDSIRVLSHDRKEHQINPIHRKENGFSESYIGMVYGKDGIKEVCDLRIYWAGQTCYVCLWIKDEKSGDYVGGSGKAGGGGYHKPSAAAATAISTAGYVCNDSICGRGDSAIEEAVNAICKYYHPAGKIHVVHAHA